MRTDSWLGVGNDSIYNKTRCLEAFAFSDPTDPQRSRIRELGEQLDAHSKRQQRLHPGLTMTGMYNVLEQLRRGEALSAKEREIHEQGLVAVLAPALVGKPGGTTLYKAADQSAAEEILLTRLVALNAERAAEEARGIVRWLCPNSKTPKAVRAPKKPSSKASLPMTKLRRCRANAPGQKPSPIRSVP